MRYSHRFSWALAACISAVVFLMAASMTQSQPPAKEPAVKDSKAIAQINVGRIYTSHVRYISAMEKLKKDRSAAEDELRGDNQRLEAMIVAARTLTPEEVRAKEPEILKLKADYEVRAKLTQKQFSDRETKINKAVYKEIKDETQIYCTMHGIKLLIRAGDTAVESFSANNEALQEINRTVIYSKDVDVPDITDDFLKWAIRG